ncbi:ATP synthase F1 subunit epsilon [bacterium]|nr:ATP synthase F1 subunit epsilon [bacterium]
MNKFHLKIITPEKIIFDDQVTQVILPTTDGQVGIMAGHVPYMAPLKADELRVFAGREHDDDHEQAFAIDFGLAEFVDNHLVVLVAEAASAEMIDLDLAEQAKARAQELMAQKVSDEDYTNALAMLERETAKIKVASKYRLKHRVQ